jgi:hypothetical protein
MDSKCYTEQLIKDGSSQGGRYLDALDPAKTILDNRSPEDLLVFAKHYADLVRFYDINQDVEWLTANNENNNAANAKDVVKKPVYTWKEFFYQDIAVVIASIAQYRDKLPLIKQEYDDKRKQVDSNPVIENYRDLFKTIIHLLKRVSRWHSRSIDDHPLKNELELKINSTLTPSLKKLVGYDKGSHVVKDAGLGLVNEYDFFKTGFLQVNYDGVQRDESIYEGKGVAQQIKHAALYVDDIFQGVLKVYKELTERNAYYFTTALENYPEHQPHMALFLAFIKLFTYVQKELNGLSQRHLEFYYRDVLHLHERAASPDAVYLIYELAKEAREYDLKAGTSLTAGKDAAGKELIYKTENDLVINKAKVKELKTIFLDKGSVADPELIKNIYAAPVARSADGNGTPFTVAETAWPALGYFIPEVDSSQKVINKIGVDAEMGFAIASPQLFLSEGIRRITISGINLTALKGFLEIQLTGEKEWIKVKNIETDATPPATNDTTLRYFVQTDGSITINLPTAEPAIIAYDKQKHGEGYDTNYPVLKLILSDSSKYELLKTITVSAINTDVFVKGVKNLYLENDQAVLDSSKAIYPFTQLPKQGYSFYIGNKEVFYKSLYFLELGFDEIETVLINAKRSVANMAILNDRNWKYATDGNKNLEVPILSPVNLNPLSKFTHRETDYSNYPSKDNSLSGFLRLDLASAISSDLTIIDRKVVLPPTFIIKNLKLDYKSIESSTPGIEQFFHIYPFGTIETFPVNSGTILFDDLDKSKDNLLIRTNYLLPQIKFGSNNDNFNGENQYQSAIYQQGNLLIGIEELKLPQNLSLLFKIADGTAEDNDSDPPEINWSYLVNNEWRPLPRENIVSDTTYNLQTTGIMLFDFPADATNNNTIVTKGLHWLSGSVDKYADRIPRIINVIAQANKAVFVDQKNDPLHYSVPLPAESIAKLVVKVPEVKMVNQPFESFDGKMREDGRVFYARASERLRHKHRAITPWDYEHMVLQHFPSIYKVKCLTHTDPDCICRHTKTADDPPIIDTGKCCCGQVAPGHVLIVPVSNLRNKNVVDILKPRTGRRTLLQIEEYLKKLSSPFVHVQAKNPTFEEIKTAFDVKFYSGTDKGKYLRQLNDDIVKYLTPWAFDTNKEIVFGGSIYASAIINFIEELDYVEYISCFRMIHIVKGCCKSDTFRDLSCTQIRQDLDTVIDPDPDPLKEIKLRDRCLNMIQATSPRAILTSAKKHCIELIPTLPKTKDCNCS